MAKKFKNLKPGDTIYLVNPDEFTVSPYIVESVELSAKSFEFDVKKRYSDDDYQGESYLDPNDTSDCDWYTDPLEAINAAMECMDK